MLCVYNRHFEVEATLTHATKQASDASSSQYILKCGVKQTKSTNLNMAPSYKISYFDLPGRAEPTRLLFAYGGVKYEDERFTFDDWPKYKPNTPYGQAPVLYVDGEPIAQSKAIARYAAKIVKLTGKNELEDLKIDSVIDFISDFEEKVIQYKWRETDEAKKEELYKALMKEHAPFFLKKLDAIAQANGGYLAVNRLTWADLYFINAVEACTNSLKKDVFADFPNLIAVKKNVLTIPTIKDYIKNRVPCSMYTYDLKQDL